MHHWPGALAKGERQGLSIDTRVGCLSASFIAKAELLVWKAWPDLGPRVTTPWLCSRRGSLPERRQGIRAEEEAAASEAGFGWHMGKED